MGSSLRWVALVSLVALAGCPPNPGASCGWDAALDEGASYDVTLEERYSMASTMFIYEERLDLARPTQTCGSLDEIAEGETMRIRLVQGPGPHNNLDCSFWLADVTSPAIDLPSPLPGLLNTVNANVAVASGVRDFGGGCSGQWELEVHGATNEPFGPQPPGASPILMVYRVFATNSSLGDPAACAAITGGAVGPDGGFHCGDAWAASISQAP